MKTNAKKNKEIINEISISNITLKPNEIQKQKTLEALKLAKSLNRKVIKLPQGFSYRK